MEITARDFERIRQENLRVRLTDFARLWLAAEQRAGAMNRDGQGSTRARSTTAASQAWTLTHL